MHPTDYRVITADFEEMFGAYRTDERPAGLTGTNFMTPTWLGYVRIGGPVEVTLGYGFDNEPIFGLTWGRLADGSCDPRDRLVHSLNEAREYLMSLTGHRVGQPLP
jgi:hypothetical protein